MRAIWSSSGYLNTGPFISSLNWANGFHIFRLELITSMARIDPAFNVAGTRRTETRFSQVAKEALFQDPSLASGKGSRGRHQGQVRKSSSSSNSAEAIQSLLNRTPRDLDFVQQQAGFPEHTRYRPMTER